MMTNAESNIFMGTITIRSAEHGTKTLPEGAMIGQNVAGRVLMTIMTTSGGPSGCVRTHVGDWKVQGS